MRLFIAIFLSATLLAAAGMGGYELVWQVDKLAVRDSSQARQCGPTKSLSMDIMKNRHLGFLSTSIDDKGNVYMYFLGQTGDWEVLNVLPGAKDACVYMQGTNWQFIAPAFVLEKKASKLKH